MQMEYVHNLHDDLRVNRSISDLKKESVSFLLIKKRVFFTSGANV
jgi:hypothetical protein